MSNGVLKCLTGLCRQDAAANCRGLCMKCYSSAKKAVERGEVTWDELVELGAAYEVPDAFKANLERLLAARKKQGA